MNTVLNNINKSRYFSESASNTKIEDLKNQLENQNEKIKLEGMKKLIAMMSKGRDVSEAFPAVVKNVIAKNLELKKLVYMFLVHYSEVEPDSALLSINTIQRSLSDQSQVIKASALRVMSSIRVLDIIQVIVLAIEKSIKDSSPFVRKAAAFAITKVHKLDTDKQEELIDLLDHLLSDSSTMVLGAAMVAFSEVCPDRFDLLHQHYRKICQLLADFDEWSQVITIGILTKYARSQFKCPDSSINDKNPNSKSKKKSTSFYSDSEDDDETDKRSVSHSIDSLEAEEIDADHRLLLKSALPLLQSRNNSVVMAVASLYFYCAPVIEAQKVGKSLVRILRCSPEVQFIALHNISTMVTMRPNMFEPHLSEFFINSGDPEYCIKLKLEILTRLATAENISKILKEFKEYIKNEDKKFVALTIHSIGSCAATIPDVTESCISGLMSLLSHSSSVVVAESVIVLKRLLQTNAENPKSNIKYQSIILHLAKLLETLQVPAARSAIIWVIGEYCTKVPLVAPDVLRKLAKSFSDEDTVVKLQTITLGSKLYFHNPDQTKLIFQYILNQAKFDLNYDVRDTSRMLRSLLITNENAPTLASNSKEFFINKKPTPTEISISQDRQRFILGSLSHIVNHSAMGYQTLPDFPEVAPDPSVRQPKQKWVQPNLAEERNQKLLFKQEYEKSFYSDESEDDDEEFSGGSDEEDEDEEDEEEEENSQDELDKFFSDSSDNNTPKKKKLNGNHHQNNKKKPKRVDGEDDEDEEEEDEDEDDMDELFGVGKSSTKQLVDEMEKLVISTPPVTHSIKKILLKQNISGGLGIEYCFIRKSEPVEPGYNSIQLYIKNHTADETISNISIINKNLIEGANIQDFQEIDSILPGESIEQELNLTFNSTSQPCKFEITSSKGIYPVLIAPMVGELFTPLDFDLESWKSEFGESSSSTTTTLEEEIELGEKCAQSKNNIATLILEAINLQPVATNKTKSKIHLAGNTLFNNLPILVEITTTNTNNNDNNIAHCIIKSRDNQMPSLLLKK
eukprot:gene11829-14469_t